VTVWREVRRAWYVHRGFWRKHLPLFGVREVGIVEVGSYKVRARLAVSETDRYVTRFPSQDRSQKTSKSRHIRAGLLENIKQRT
jgi:hypothetical protein